MPQSLAKLYVHIVYSTKYRFPFIDSDIEDELFAYMGGTIRELGGFPFKINGMPDHVHICSSLPRTISIAKYVEEIKRNSSKWIKTKGEAYLDFAWQNGYAAFSVSPYSKNIVVNYIADQKKHHKKLSFKDELLLSLKKHKIEYNTDYLWD